MTLNAQLTIALAADSRAISFASILSAAVAVVLGGSAAAFGSQAIADWYGVAGIVAAAGLLIAIFLAGHSARPTEFNVPGNWPSSWIPDIANGLSREQSLAQQAAIYEKHLDFNHGVLSTNGQTMRWAYRSALVALGLAFVIVIVTAASS